MTSKPEQSTSDRQPKVSILKNANDNEPGKNQEDRRHTIYEVINVPTLESKTVPINEKVTVLKRLKYQNEIKVKQYFEDTEDVVGFGMSNTYVVTCKGFDPTEESVLFFIGEKISCEATWLKTSGRALNFKIYNPDGDAIGFINRPSMPYFCFFNICPCCTRNSYNVSLADGRLFGKVKKTYKFSKPVFSIYDSEDTQVLELSGPDLGHIFPCWEIQNSRFVEKGETALINKQHTAACEENVYQLSIDHMMDVKNKMLLVALIVLIDLQHFRRCATLCHFLVFLVWVFGFFATCCYIFYICVVKDQR